VSNFFQVLFLFVFPVFSILFAFLGLLHLLLLLLWLNPPISALPDGGFLRQIWTILADLKVVWREIFISGGFPISGGFLADLTNSAQVYFLSDRSGGILAVFVSLLTK
jgi:hypothetical protein